MTDVMLACSRCGVRRWTSYGRRNLCRDCYPSDAAVPVIVSGASSWWERGACRDLQDDTFFPPSDGADNLEVKVAKAICRNCPVVAECFADAMATPTGQDHGIRGGTTARERRARRDRARRRAA